MKRIYGAWYGTRQLSASEVDLFARLRATGDELIAALKDVENHVTEQHTHAQSTEDVPEMERLTRAEPFKWIESAQLSLETSLMYAARAIAQPTRD